MNTHYHSELENALLSIYYILYNQHQFIFYNLTDDDNYICYIGITNDPTKHYNTTIFSIRPPCPMRLSNLYNSDVQYRNCIENIKSFVTCFPTCYEVLQDYVHIKKDDNGYKMNSMTMKGLWTVHRNTLL